MLSKSSNKMTNNDHSTQASSLDVLQLRTFYVGLRERTSTKKKNKQTQPDQRHYHPPLRQSKSTVSCWIVLLGRHSTTQHSHHSYRHMNQRHDAVRAQRLLFPTSYFIQGQTWGTGITHGWAMIHFFSSVASKQEETREEKIQNLPLELNYVFPAVFQF